VALLELRRSQAGSPWSTTFGPASAQRRSPALSPHEHGLQFDARAATPAPADGLVRRA
jgi:hypothetical protein